MIYFAAFLIALNGFVLLRGWWTYSRSKTFTIHHFEDEYESWYKVAVSGRFLGPNFSTEKSAKKFIKALKGMMD